jgi:hypothetical protein
MTLPLRLMPNQKSLARSFLCISNGKRKNKSHTRRFAVVRFSAHRCSKRASCTLSRSCCTSSECLAVMSVRKKKTDPSSQVHPNSKRELVMEGRMVNIKMRRRGGIYTTLRIIYYIGHSKKIQGLMVIHSERTR